MKMAVESMEMAPGAIPPKLVFDGGGEAKNFLD
jgi:hypothetical protein